MDRRRILLRLTPEGRALVRAARGEAQTRLATALATLTPGQRLDVTRALRVLRPVFMPTAASTNAEGE